MALRLAIVGLDGQQREWLAAVETLRAAGEIELVGLGHRSLAAARDLAGVFKGPSRTSVAVFDDLRLLLNEVTPQVILLDRPENATLEFLLSCISADVGLLSLGPPVETLAEAQALAGALAPRSRLLYIWPRLVDSPVYRHGTHAHDYVRPMRFAGATWLGANYALARDTPSSPLRNDLAVRSLSVLAWDALATFIELIDLPTSIYASIRGTVSSTNVFADLSGAAALTLRFPDDATASITLCDRVADAAALPGGGGARQLMLWGQAGMFRLTADSYEFRDSEGKLVDRGSVDPAAGNAAVAVLRDFISHYAEPPSPHRGWVHRLDTVAACMEAMLVSHRTGQAESPEKFQRMRR